MAKCGTVCSVLLCLLALMLSVAPFEIPHTGMDDDIENALLPVQVQRSLEKTCIRNSTVPNRLSWLQQRRRHSGEDRALFSACFQRYPGDADILPIMGACRLIDHEGHPHHAPPLNPCAL